MMLADENAYDPVATNTAVDHASLSREATTLATRVKRFITSSFIVMAFVFIGYLGIKLFLEKQWLTSFTAVSFALMLIPMVDHTSTLRQRLAVSLVMPFALAGLASFVWLYFLMFRFRWFEEVFNGQDFGPLGLIVFALVGLVVGGTAGWRLINYPRAR